MRSRLEYLAIAFLCVCAVRLHHVKNNERMMKHAKNNVEYYSPNDGVSEISGIQNEEEKVHEDKQETEEFACAPWIPVEKRKILMHSFLDRFITWEDHLEGKRKGGEPYWGACLHYVLQELGFEVLITDKFTKQLDPEGEELQKLKHGEIHRFVTDSSSGGNFVGTIWGMPELLCKIRMMCWWPNRKNTNFGNSVSPMKYDESAATSAHFVPFFVHGEITDPPITEMIDRPRKSVFLFERFCSNI
jgi:hypothetical protein